MTIFQGFSKPRVVRLNIDVGWSATTVYPFVFVFGKLKNESATFVHEMVHWQHQHRWWRAAGVFGWFAWFFLYLFVLPAGWNRFRWNVEFEAYTIDGRYIDEIIRKGLREKYLLWWMK